MKISTIAVVSSFLAATACAASTPTPELVSARQAYDRARTDPRAALVPDSVLSAKQALDRAESVHEKDPQSDAERSYSYVAQRRAELALALGENARTKQQADFGGCAARCRAQSGQSARYTAQRSRSTSGTRHGKLEQDRAGERRSAWHGHHAVRSSAVR